MTPSPSESCRDCQNWTLKLEPSKTSAIPALLEPRFSAPATHSLTRFASSNGVIAVQAFMALLAAQMIGSAIENFISTTQALFFGGGEGTWIIVLFLTYHWVAQQAPLTLKTIRRTRA